MYAYVDNFSRPVKIFLASSLFIFLGRFKDKVRGMGRAYVVERGKEYFHVAMKCGAEQLKILRLRRH